MMSNFFVIFWISIAACDVSPSLHHLIKPEERLELFGTNEPPEHQVVPITFTRLQKRGLLSGNTAGGTIQPFYVKLKCLGYDSKLAGKNTPIYHVRNNSNNLVIRANENLDRVEFYENAAEAATFTACTLSNRQTITGVIRSKRLVIRPLPEHIVDRMNRHRRSLDNSTANESHQYHLVIKMTESSDIMYNKIQRFKRETVLPEIYPQILVIVDNWLYRLLRNYIVPYVLSHWHAIDLLYRNLIEPKIRLNIAAIYIAMDENALNYMTPSTIYSKIDDPVYDVGMSLEKMGHWLFSAQGLDKYYYDVAFTMTLADLYKGSSKIEGLSYKGGACDVNFADQTMKKVAIIKNDGAFDRMDRGAYELGHLLNAEYDRRDTENTWLHGILPEPYQGIAPSWPEATREQFTRYFRFGNSRCLFNEPNPGAIIPIDLPGTIMDADQQCKRLGHEGFSNQTRYMCDNLQCLSKDGSIVAVNQRAAAGTPCGREKICFYGACIDE